MSASLTPRDHRGAAADLVLVGANVRTLDRARPGAGAVAVRGDVILAVGEAADVRDWRGPHTEVVDLGGATLTPGLVDAHLHPVSGLEMAVGADLSACRDLDQLRTVLAHTAARTPPGGWVRGWGLDPNVFGDRHVTTDLVEDALGGAPAYLLMFDVHSALASRRALELAGVAGPRRFADRSKVVCDAYCRPTGHLLEMAAMSLVERVIPAEPLQARRDRLRRLLSDMAATGLTGGHVMDCQGDSLDLLTALEDGDDLPLRLRIAPFCLPGADRDELEHLVRLQRRRGRDWQVGAVKFMIDGTVDGGTAWLEEPDTHGESAHSLWLDPADYTAAVHHLARAGVPTVTHAIGDAGVRHTLDTLGALPPGSPRLLHRVEHIETLAPDQVPRFAALGVIASMQPTHCTDYTRADHGDNWSQRLGDQRADRGWACRDLRESGATLALGSDWPVAPYDPRAVLAAARLRRPAGAPDAVPNQPAQALTPLMAIEGYTTHAARAAGEESRSGRIVPGHRADLTAFAVDPLTAPPDELAQADIGLTVSGGRITHRA
ncbi:amidohydrolase [Streptomyces sp. NBC_01275]|uniref:amidohydrolase n=1 Tax=Streptomyces sp. NBC_01275 TaxID=2903807 RepID=UPI00224DDB3B|nr:amidohydrolase [Streptomyces sp. NBC_01275]MCX4761972.1 amidohydrolase [Streptomyces sp. NBC_01275]